MSYKVAYILTGENIYRRRGLLSAALNRVKHLLPLASYEITIYAVANKESWLFRFLKKRDKQDMPSQMEIDGVSVKLIWMPLTVLDIFMSTRLRYKPFIRYWFFRTQSSQFKSYDLLVAHSSFAISIADNVKRRYNIPYCAIWHGSDIHTLPFRSKYIFKQAKNAIKNANTNFFVSKKLLDTSERICKSDNKYVLYNGIGDNFIRYDDRTRKRLRTDLGINPDNKVIGFVGNLIPIKNADLLPEIFHDIESQYKGRLTFLVVGDGKLRKCVEEQTKAVVNRCLFLGDYPCEKMPEIMNCIDLLVLPSRNEGLPLVTLEALACGAAVIGSNVGGIREVIGDDNVVELGEHFVQRFSTKVVELLITEMPVTQLPSQFDWGITAGIENDIYTTILQSTDKKD